MPLPKIEAWFAVKTYGWGRATMTLSMRGFSLAPVALAAAVLFAMVGCASVVHRPSVAIAVTVAGGSAPSSKDVAFIQKAMLPEIEKAGYRLAGNPYSADYVMEVRFASDPTGAGGHITVVNVTPNNGVNDGAAAARELKINSDRAITEMVREPKE